MPAAKFPKLPEWIEPMAATLTQERFSGPEWSFEQKFDGIRLIAFKNGRDVRLFSRNRLPQNVPAVSQAVSKLKHEQLSRRRNHLGPRPGDLSRVRHHVG
jgi:ATP-dependent DNA ligase